MGEYGLLYSVSVEQLFVLICNLIFNIYLLAEATVYAIIFHLPAMSLWRNWLARSAVNRKVGGSSPPRDVNIFNQISIPFSKCSALYSLLTFSHLFRIQHISLYPCTEAPIYSPSYHTHIKISFDIYRSYMHGINIY